MAEPTPLAEVLRRQIDAAGPISVAELMAAALFHPVHGYYAARARLGAEGDFITSPEISPVFGEMIAVFLIGSWMDLGTPGEVDLVELGPGTGRLMADVLGTAARVAPDFVAAARVVLVEASPRLAARQDAALAGLSPHAIGRSDRFPADGERPLLLLANEFLDALPIRQFLLGPDGLRERLVGIGADGALAFIASPPLPAPGEILGRFAGRPVPAPPTLLEISPQGEGLIAAAAARIARSGGRALFIDYGYASPPGRSTLAALEAHRPVEALARLGSSDLSAHVDFGALARLARSAGAAVDGPKAQGAFLDALGFAARIERMAARASPSERAALARVRDRLTGDAGMGRLFQALALSHPGLPPCPGF